MAFWQDSHQQKSNFSYQGHYSPYHQQKKTCLNRFISNHNDRLYLGWVFLRSKIFNQLPTDIHHFCYTYVNESQLIINLQNFEQNKESLSDFFYALITSSMAMVELHSIVYKNKIYKSNTNNNNITYPKDPESVKYNLSCFPNRFNIGGISMRYHNRINHINDDIVIMFKIIEKFLKNQNLKSVNNQRLLENIKLNFGKDYTLIILRNGDNINDKIKYNKGCEIALYEYSNVVWKDRVNLYDLLKGIIKIKSNKWKCNDKTEIINHVLQLINHSSKQITLYIDLKTSDLPRRLS